MATFELLTRSTRRPVAVIASIALVGHQPQTELAQQGNVARCIFEDRIDEHRLTVVAQPRAYTPGSIMPPYPYLFEVRKGAAQPGETVVNLPPSFANPGEVVIATPEALALVNYLLALDRTYPALAPLPTPAASAAAAANDKP